MTFKKMIFSTFQEFNLKFMFIVVTGYKCIHRDKLRAEQRYRRLRVHDEV